MKTTGMKLIPALLIIFFLVPAFCTANESRAVGRYALIIGSNNGGESRVKLKFAGSDALAFSAVLQEMGGLSPHNQVLLLDPSLNDITTGFLRIHDLIARDASINHRSEFIIYYSGHSDEEGLLLNGKVLAYSDLRKLISSISADVRIAIIDSCASGVFIRSKGGTKKPAFMVDSSTDMKGYAFLTSSSENESAQESDRISASFFTHHFIGGLRGAADVTQDGVVTLNEAYHYSFTETLATTEKTQFGPQHPSYDIQLTGTGDLVLTDLRETSSGIVFEDSIAGRISIRNARGDLVVELKKNSGAPMEIGISPGKYSILIERESMLKAKDIVCASGSRTRLSERDFSPVGTEYTTRRGDDTTAAAEPRIVYQPFAFTFLPTEIKREDNVQTITTIQLNLLIGSSDTIHGVALSSIGSHLGGSLSGATLSGVYNILDGSGSGAMFSGVFNINNGRFSGAQGCGVFNYSTGGIAGFQGSGVFNIARGDVSGMQGSGVFNFATGELAGVQASGVLNIAQGNTAGAQIAGLYNSTIDLDGAQISGGLNIASKVNGVQIGLINIAHETNGVQVGLINFSEDQNGVAIGLFNYSKNGIHNFEIWVDQDVLSNVAFKFGTKHFYTILLGGYSFASDDELWQFGLGWGFHIPIDFFFIDIDAVLTSIHTTTLGWANSFEKTLLPHLRAKAGFIFLEAIGLFAGVDLQFHSPYGYYNETIAGQAWAEFPVDSSGNTCKIVPRFFAGIQLLK